MSEKGGHGDPRNKYRTRRAQQEVRRLLMEWDPIGVADEDDAWGEYDCMISPLLRLLAEGTDVAGLTRWIGAERRDHFGLGENPADDAHLAARLMAWWDRRDEGTAQATAN